MPENVDNRDKNKQMDEILYTHGIEQYMLPETNFLNHGKAIPENLSIASSIRERSGFNRHDFYEKRPEQSLPTTHQDIIASCQAIYRKLGFVRNIIDMMADFASEGLELAHPNKKEERFYKKWAEKVGLTDRVNTFMRLLIRDANVIIRRKMAYLTLPVAKEMSQAFIGYKNQDPLALPVIEDIVDEIPEKILKDKKGKKREIPWRYVFLSPTRIKKTAGEVGRFFGDKTVAIELPMALVKSIKSPKTEAEKNFVNQLPREIISAVKGSKGSQQGVLITLNSDNLYIDYYKKDDWEDWATPFLYCVLEDVLFKEKMRLADMAALDGVINVIRLWKLGNSQEKIFPTPAAVNKLIDILQHNTGGGVMDLVWNDMIELDINFPPTDKILGPEKYRSVDRDIVQGLGVPDSLIGGTDLGTRNAQSAFVQLKTLQERLEYVRSRALEWIKNELRIVASAMGFKTIPVVNFSSMSLRDEAAEKKLIMGLLDRNIISVESVQRVFGFDFVIELERMKSEKTVMNKNRPVLEKAGPFYRPESVMEFQKEAQLEVQKLVNESKGLGDPGGDNPDGDLPKTEEISQPGRPSNDVEIGPRDKRTNVVFSVYKTTASDLMDKIDAVIDPVFLTNKEVKNLRSLTHADKKSLENLKYYLLAISNDNDNITRKKLMEKLADSKAKQNIKYFMDLHRYLCSQYLDMTGKSPCLKDRCSLAESAWTILKLKDD